MQPGADIELFAKFPKYAAEKDRLAMAVKSGEPGALQKIVVFHMPLARHSSKMLIRWFGMDADDAEQTAKIGLIQAANRFDPDKGYQFSTYASFWIRQACQRYGIEWGLPIHVPVHYFWACYKLTFLETQLIATFGPQDAREHFERILAEFGVTLPQWRHFCLVRHLKLFSDVDRRELARADRPEESILEVPDDAPAQVVIQRALQTLHPRQATILKLRYGIGQQEHSLRDVAAMLGLTHERIRQIQEHAEMKLRRFLRKTNRFHYYGPGPDEPDGAEVEELENCP